MTKDNNYQNSAIKIAAANDADIYFYSGPVVRTGYEAMCKCCHKAVLHKNAILILTTYGGDAHAAYRIARALRHNYESLFVIIPRECKSAGTLIAIGATELAIADQGELGPLDVQIAKTDEMFERNSGLDITQALLVLQSQAMDSFRGYLLDIKLGSGISLKASAEIATNLTVGLYSPIYGQIDPIKLGEIQRAIAIADAYGERLDGYNKNLKPNALNKLILGYPSHGFVIDRKEARSLFHNVRSTTPDEELLANYLYDLCPPDLNSKEPIVFDVLATLEGGGNSEHHADNTSYKNETGPQIPDGKDQPSQYTTD